MSKRLVFVHGRAQEGMSGRLLKEDWIQVLKHGLAKSGLSLPISDNEISFPYYGDTLFDLTNQHTVEESAEIITYGNNIEDPANAFIRSVLDEVCKEKGITQDVLNELADDDVKERGVLNWAWVQVILRGIDEHCPGGSGAAIAMATYDVYQYLYNGNIKKLIDKGVGDSFAPDTQTVVVSHSLGTVVAYNILSQYGKSRRWQVPLFVTLGSPLAVTAIHNACKRIALIRCPECADNWYNARDPRDVVPLYPLTPDIYPLDPSDPAIINKFDVNNETPNRHGISGYLGDKDVAARIYQALTE